MKLKKMRRFLSVTCTPIKVGNQCRFLRTNTCFSTCYQQFQLKVREHIPISQSLIFRPQACIDGNVTQLQINLKPGSVVVIRFYIRAMEYKLITEDRYDDVIRHLRDNFFADEPLNKAAGLCRRGVGHRDLEHHSLVTLDDNLSLMAVNENDEIAGVILNGVLRPGDIEKSEKKLQLNDDEKFKKIFKLLYNLNLRENVFQKFHVEKAFDVRILSVDSQYRGQGIAKHLVKHSEVMAKDNGFKLLKADATGIFSQKILKSNGFDVLLEQYYNKYVDECGKPILNVESPHIKLQLLYKILN